LPTVPGTGKEKNKAGSGNDILWDRETWSLIRTWQLEAVTKAIAAQRASEYPDYWRAEPSLSIPKSGADGWHDVIAEAGAGRQAIAS
jgi:hypothetical protein